MGGGRAEGVLPAGPGFTTKAFIQAFRASPPHRPDGCKSQANLGDDPRPKTDVIPGSRRFGGNEIIVEAVPRAGAVDCIQQILELKSMAHPVFLRSEAGL